ncbi:flagellar motor stator protein MotA [Legionella taurinensis]|uniref:Flagellar motor stator protein MotA n=1 Tax=Legionella taurinensis TaxID=70611 RepID=A0A3A5LJ41_9GAMM|nr:MULTISPECIES: flagellar motor stator protein MotA [Legionella]MDX1837412.1 flagellar motor stator protein MotA [Legionella taurinensis]PUT40759.1 flagellar motor stator protein MotA [Legionella taurinensis]PUT44181.1 flagellar motor stator protein MotA [Legionella taurinensis]PUT47482.1 flagellar motor stator protein MotA [Legionella taurinensis]PUT48621.1 flagellar motor stator protein MotA [Legionella taurinensis]
MLIIIGYIVILLCVFGGFALAGGHLAAVFQPLELLIIGGAAVGALIVGNSPSVLKAIGKALPAVFKGQKSEKVMYMDLLALLYALLNKSRQEGLMSLETDVDDPANSPIFTNFPRLMAKHHIIEFICDYFRLIITSNLQPHQLEALMDSEIETHHNEEMIPAQAITKLADGMPAFGIVAAVLGVVHTMESIHLPPAELGVLVAHALVGTFLGILLGYGFVGPVANAMEQRANSSQLMLNCIKVTILASMNNNPPIIATEFGRKVLFSASRPSFNELNEQIKSASTIAKPESE